MGYLYLYFFMYVFIMTSCTSDIHLPCKYSIDDFVLTCQHVNCKPL